MTTLPPSDPMSLRARDAARATAAAAAADAERAADALANALANDVADDVADNDAADAAKATPAAAAASTQAGVVTGVEGACGADLTEGAGLIEGSERTECTERTERSELSERTERSELTARTERTERAEGAATPSAARAPSTWTLVSAGRQGAQPVRTGGTPRIAHGTPTLSVSLHDVAPATWPACERVLRAVEAVAPVRVALLVVPRYRGVDSARDAQFMRAIEARIKRGDEVVLHGWTHVDDLPLPRPWGQPIDLLRRRVYTAGEGEFAALDRMEALRRIHAGVGWFAAQGWPLRGFVAPAWLMSRGARAALADTSLQYAATRNELLLLAAGTTLRAPSLCWSTRSRLRRTLSPPWNAALSLLNSTRPLLRLALHPQDADHDVVRESWQRALFEALQTRAARTEGDVADDWIAATCADVLPDPLDADDLAADDADDPVTAADALREMREMRALRELSAADRVTATGTLPTSAVAPR